MLMMSSIAYVTDHKMIEYHRLNGNQTIIFWRPTSQKKFTDFQEGEYLFFLAKGSEKGRQREKGIVGYGRFTREYTVSFQDMWKRFKTLCGYEKKEQLYEAIVRVAKNQKLPEKLHCLKLENVIFFQTPIYLSELNVQISKQVESYIYLDQEDILISSKIIKKAAGFGQDVWSRVVADCDRHFRYDSEVIAMQNLRQRLKDDIYTSYEKHKIMQFVQAYQGEQNYHYLVGGQDDFAVMHENQVSFYIPCVTSLMSFQKNLPSLIGRYELYKGILKTINSDASVFLLLDQPLSPLFKQVLDATNISYIEYKLGGIEEGEEEESRM